MFKNFEDLNDLQSGLVESSTAASVRGALGVQSDLLAVVHNAVNEYVDVYNKVRATRINPDTRTPEDVTGADFNSAPNNVLAQVRAQLTEKAQLLGIYVENIRDEFEETTVTSEVTLSSSNWTVVSQEPTSINVFGTYVPIQDDMTGWKANLPTAMKPTGSLNLGGSGFVTGFFALYGSKAVVTVEDSMIMASYAEYVKDDIHVFWGVAYVFGVSDVFLGAWDGSAGSAFMVTGRSPSVVDYSNIHGVADILIAANIVARDDYAELSTYGGVTKTAVPAAITPASVSGNVSVRLNPGAVIEKMFVSQGAISDAIDALAGTSN